MAKPAVAAAKVAPAPAPAPAPDFEIEEDDAVGDDAVSETDFPIFHTETITPPPVAKLGRGEGVKYPFEKLTAVGQWFLLPATFNKKGVASNVYRKRKDGTRFKMIKIDERFATAIKRPEFVGRTGVWRVEDATPEAPKAKAVAGQPNT